MAVSQRDQDAVAAQPAGISRLFEPTYQNRLRVAGRALDERGLELAIVIDLGDAILVRGHAPADGAMAVEILPDAELPIAMQALLDGARSAGAPAGTTTALRPTGYEDFLRALGYRLDRQGAAGIAIVECPRYIHVSGFECVGEGPEAVMAPFAHLYEAPKVNCLVNEAIARRDHRSLTGGLSTRNIETGPLGRVMHSTGPRR